MSEKLWKVRREGTAEFVKGFWSPFNFAAKAEADRFVDLHPGTYAVEE